MQYATRRSQTHFRSCSCLPPCTLPCQKCTLSFTAACHTSNLSYARTFSSTRLSSLYLLELASCCLRCRSLAMGAQASCHLSGLSRRAILKQGTSHTSATEQQRSYHRCAAGMSGMIPDQSFPEPAPAFTVLLASFIPGKLTCRRCTSARLPALCGTPAHRVRPINKREFPV